MSSRLPHMLETVTEIFGPEGELARHLPDFAPRAGQLAMALDVCRNLMEPGVDTGQGSFLAIEAGTGTGKTLAYLVPAALSGKKIVISTGTKNLQDQILQKEVPFLRKHIAPGLKALCIKGRQNYLCLYRWQQFYAHPQQELFALPAHLADLASWIDRTPSGDRSEIPWLQDENPLWQEISATGSQCLGSNCPVFSDCFLTRLRQQAGRADLVIVNHHLFFSDLVLRQAGHAEALPRYEAVIFDEAHHLEEVAGQHFGFSFSTYQMNDLAHDLEKTAGAELHGKKRSTILSRAGGLKQLAERFLAFFPKTPGRYPLQPLFNEAEGWQSMKTELMGRLDGLADHLSGLSTGNDSWAVLSNRCRSYNSLLLQFDGAEDHKKIYWYERRKKSVSLLASPIDVADELQSFYQQVPSIVFASATLTTAGAFTYFVESLGLPEHTDSRIVEAPFFYQEQSLVYVPENSFPPPGSPEFQQQSQRRILELLTSSKGRALVLFTSLEAMNGCSAFLKKALPYPLLVQGSAPRQTLLDRFSKETHSVLLAVASFWEGIDVPGQSLSCLIIDKLPFAVPSDPVLQAKLQHISEKGGNPFMDFQVPRAVLTLRQGVGRLIRSTTDQGLIAILDVRLFTKPYGRIFRKSLPPSPITRELEPVRKFFAALR
jgi:ATP-dependent DNA helicase DinG